MRKTLFILKLLVAFKASAQTGTIRGRIVDNVTERSLEGVSVVFTEVVDIE